MRWKTFLLIFVAVIGAAAWAEGWKVADPDYAWDFPRDHWAHPEYRTEWWYFTGHLETAEGRRFGYQFTFFRLGILQEVPELESDWATGEMIMGHGGLTFLPTSVGEAIEDGNGRAVAERRHEGHRFSEVLYRATSLLGEFGIYPDPLLAWSRAPAGTDDRWELEWNGEGFDFRMADAAKGIAFELSTRPEKPQVFQGPNGYSRKGAGPSSASQYYSMTRLSTQGTITVDGQEFSVTGQSWMDKEFGSNQLSDDQSGWDWFSLQLDDGRELMLYTLRGTSAEAAFARGTVVEIDGTARYLDGDAFSVEPTGSWESEATGARYPSGWRVTLADDGLELVVTPEVEAQENRSHLLPKLFYWEGAVKVETRAGAAMGKGYVELTGYGTERVPKL